MFAACLYMTSVLFFITATQPLSMLIVIVAQGLSLMYLMSYMSESPWATMTIFLLYLGGVMIIFLYINSFINQIVGFPTCYYFLIVLFIVACFGQKTLSLQESQGFLAKTFYSNKEMMFIFAVLFVFLMIFLINLFLFNVKSPMNTNL